MDFDTLSIVKFGDVDSLGEFLFENAVQHKVFQEKFQDLGYPVPIYPLADANPDNLDDWLLAHQVEHQAFAGLLGLNNPFNMLDVDFNNESEFYDWIASHLYIHEQINAALDAGPVTATQAGAPVGATGGGVVPSNIRNWENNLGNIVLWSNNSSALVAWITTLLDYC